MGDLVTIQRVRIGSCRLGVTSCLAAGDLRDRLAVFEESWKAQGAERAAVRADLSGTW